MPLIDINGLQYFYQMQGSGPPLLLLHGFTGSSASWLDFLDLFSDHFQVLLIDLPGHGRSASPSATQRYSMESVSLDLMTIIDTLSLSSVNLLGYSMGGRLALYIAARHPSYIKCLVIESASPGLKTTGERNMRIDSDNRLAEEIEAIGIPTFVERWQQLPLFATQRRLPPERRETLRQQRLNNSASGLANSLRGMGTGQQPTLWPELDSIYLPTLILAGEMDQKFQSIAREMAAQIPRAELRIMADSGHDIHLEKRRLFAKTVLGFLGVSKEAVLD